jgi:enoyl-CoA hydratase/carnithine racemase
MTLALPDVTDGIAWITLNRPEKLNSITVALSEELEGSILGVGNHSDVTVAVIRRSGGNFCADGDFGEVERLPSNRPERCASCSQRFGARVQPSSHYPTSSRKGSLREIFREEPHQ